MGRRRRTRNAALADVEEIFDAAVDGDAVTLLVRNRGNELAHGTTEREQRVAFDNHKRGTPS